MIAWIMMRFHVAMVRQWYRPHWPVLADSEVRNQYCNKHWQLHLDSVLAVQGSLDCLSFQSVQSWADSECLWEGGVAGC